jgi:hypothetical protein
MVNISAAMATNLVDAINDMVNIVKELGPNPIYKSSNGPEIEFNEFETLNSHK